MIEQFIYNQQTTKIDTLAGTIEVDDLKLANIKKIFSCTSLEVDTLKKQIIIRPRSWKEDVNGVKFEFKTSPELKPRTYTNKDKTVTGVGYYDFFAGLINQPIDFREVVQSAMINNQLENMLEWFGVPLACLDPYSSWEFFLPIETEITIEQPQTETVQVDVDGETVDQEQEVANSGNFAVKIINPEAPQYTITVLEGENVIVSETDYIEDSDNEFKVQNLSSGNYSVLLKSKIDSGQKLINLELLWEQSIV